jgi:hypothetical protein
MANIYDPWDNQIINDKTINDEQVIRACPFCSYVGSSLDSTNCDICTQNLTNQKFAQNNQINIKLASNLRKKNLSAAKIHLLPILKPTRHLVRTFFKQTSARIYPRVRSCKDYLLTIWLSYPEKTKKFIILATGVLLSTLIFGFALNSANLFQSKNN